MRSIGYCLSGLAFALVIIAPPAAIADIYHCALPVPQNDNSVVIDPGSIGQNAVLSVYLQNEGTAQLYIHPRMLDGILPSDSNNPHLTSLLASKRLTGQKITAQNDAVVAKFTDNAMRQAQKTQSGLQFEELNLTGFKISLDIQGNQENHPQNTTEVIQLRVILDWSYQPRDESGATAPVYRGAFVVTRASMDATVNPVKEHDYRFLPSRRPFRALMCIEKNDMDKTLL